MPAGPQPIPTAAHTETGRAVTAPKMRAAIHDRYGPPDPLHVRDVDRPVVGGKEVLVRVHAAALHIGDCFGVRGAPLPMRMASGLFTPKYGVPGEAAAVPTSGVAALHGLRAAGRLRPGQKVLINGASGGVGMFAVQIAKLLGADVTGVCGSANRDIVRLLGADRVIDYTELDFTRYPQRYDLVLDNVENHTLADCRRALTPTGALVLNSGTGARGIRLLARLITPLVLSPFTRQTLRRFLSAPNHRDLLVLKALIEDGKLTPVIDRAYPLAETPAALHHIEGGHARGKVVVIVLAS